MKTIFTFLLTAFAFGVQAELSYTVILERCTEQNLDPHQAEVRNRWALKCFPKLKDSIEFFSSRTPVRYALVRSASTLSWKGPTREDAPCSDWEVKSFCIAACYTPDQEILFDTGFWPIGDAVKRYEKNIMVLELGSTLQSPRLKAMPVAAYSRSWRKSTEIIRVINTESGGQLKVTLNHPILLSSGVMIEAKDLLVGDRLVKQDGTLDPVVRLEDLEYSGRVYNVNPASLNPVENIVVAQGFLVGSGAYQHLKELHSLMGRKFMRSLLADDAQNRTSNR